MVKTNQVDIYLHTKVIAMIDALINKPEKEQKEKHVPFIEKLDDKTIKVTIGRDILHPSLQEHYIVWIKLYAEDAEGKFREIGSYEPTPVLSPPIAYFTCEVPKYKKFHALIFCNIHGLWEQEKSF
jgi:superoxide reductase